MALIVDIAEAVVTELNAPSTVLGAGGTFSQSFTARRLYRPEFDLAEMGDLHVTVVPKGIETSGTSRL